MNNTTRRTVGIAAGLALLAIGLAAGPDAAVIRTPDDVEQAFAARTAAIDKEYQGKIAAAREERLKGYKVLLDRAMENKNIDAAVKYREKMKSAEPGANEQGSLEKTLKGSRWEWGDESITFAADGTAQNPAWGGLVTSWKAIDRRTVILHIERGREANRYAVLSFSPNLDSYTTFDFQGKYQPRANGPKPR